jgi:hypothetical protein
LGQVSAQSRLSRPANSQVTAPHHRLRPNRVLSQGYVAGNRDLFDMFEFQRAAADLLSAEVTVYSDGALRNQHVSPDLVTATSQ